MTGYKCSRKLIFVSEHLITEAWLVLILVLVDPLAYMTAKSHGLTEECESILEATGLTEDQISLPKTGAPLTPPKPLVDTFKANWPTKATSQSFLVKALLGQVEDLSLEDEPAEDEPVEDELAEDETAATSNGFEDAEDR
jgi:coatomer protein complex subunit alpha (xenin)